MRRHWPETRLVAGREIGEKLRSRAFIISTLVFLSIIVASIALPALLFDDAPEPYDVAVVGASAQALVEAVPDDTVDLTAVAVGDEGAADAAVRDESADAALVVDDAGLRLTGLEQVPQDLRDALDGTAQLLGLEAALSAAGTPPEEVSGLLGPVAVQERLLMPSAVDSGAAELLSVAFGLLFFFIVFQFGFAIAQSVVQEKESRIVEMLVSTIPVRTLLFGKVLGYGVLALGQLVLIVLVALAGAAAVGESGLVSLLVSNGAWFVLFFVLGFALLSCLWAAAGALASRTDDLQSTTAPMQVFVLGPFFAAIYVTDGPAQVALSFFPFTSSLVMPARLVQGEAQVWEAAVAVLILLATSAVMISVGERLYRSSLLRTRGTTSIKDAWSGRAGARAEKVAARR